MNGIVAFLRLSVRNFRTCDYPYVASGFGRAWGFRLAGPDGPAARYRHRLRGEILSKTDAFRQSRSAGQPPPRDESATTQATEPTTEATESHL